MITLFKTHEGVLNTGSETSPMIIRRVSSIRGLVPIACETRILLGHLKMVGFCNIQSQWMLCIQRTEDGILFTLTHGCED